MGEPQGCSCPGYVAPNAEVEAIRASNYAVEHWPSLLAALAEGHDRVLLVPDGPSWRRELAPEHSEASAQWPRAAWEPLDDLARKSGHEVLRADRYAENVGVDVGNGILPLYAHMPSGRDVIATIARWWTESAPGGPETYAGKLTIVSGRTSLSSLVDDANGISLLRDIKRNGERWTWTVEREAAVRTRIGYDPKLVADVEALQELPSIGDKTAAALVRAYGSALVAVQAAMPDDVKLRGVDRRQMAALRDAGANGGAGILRALAIVGLRDDAPDVVEWLAERGAGDVEEKQSSEASVAAGTDGPVTEAMGLGAREPEPGADVDRAEGARARVAGVVHAPPSTHAEPVGATHGCALPRERGSPQAHDERGGVAPAGVAGAAPVREALRGAQRAEGASSGGATARDAVVSGEREREKMSDTTTETKAEIVNTQAPAPMVVHREQRALVAPGDFGAEHMRIVREAFAPSASQAEFEVMWAGAKARRLDPVRKQIHFVKRKTKRDGQWVEQWTSIVAIDGFRAIAEGTGLYDGQDEPEYEYDEENRLILARVRVWKKSISRPFVGVARWNEYVQTMADGSPTATWQKMEHTMLSKCAEALGLRKAFPEPLAGLYTGEEMAQADNERGPRETRQIAAPRQGLSRLAMRVAELAAQDDIDAARKTLTDEMAARSVPFETQQRALADFDARAGRPAA
jgi:phage recombination protein Bet